MKKIILIFILIILLLQNKVYAETEEIMESTQEKFNISDFIKKSEKYMSEDFKEIDLTEILNQSIQGNECGQTFA